MTTSTSSRTFLRRVAHPLIGFLWLSTAAVSTAHAQVPPPVDLPIANVLQETPVWCWAAVAQQIVQSIRGAATPPQCALVATAFGAPPQLCCYNPTACMTTGSLEQIQALILRFGGRVSRTAPPTDAMTLYRTLASGRPIVMAVQSTPHAGHVVVLRGMSWHVTAFGAEPVLHINDPLSYFTQPVPFRALLPYWRAAIVVS